MKRAPSAKTEAVSGWVRSASPRNAALTVAAESRARSAAPALRAGGPNSRAHASSSFASVTLPESVSGIPRDNRPCWRGCSRPGYTGSVTLLTIVLTILGLSLFETISSVDNAIINAAVLAGMAHRARRWFLLWGVLFAVFVVRGLLPWLIVWLALPGLGPWVALTAAFSRDPLVVHAVERSAPPLLMGGGVFLVLLFLHWLFLEPKRFGLSWEKLFFARGFWFYAIGSLFLAITVWFALPLGDMVAFAAVIGSTVFFITHGFKENAERKERQLAGSGMSDISKILYLEIIDMTFSIDSVLGAFAFTLSVPLILAGSGLGAVVVRQLTAGNIERIKRYGFLKNGAMYSVLVLGVVMMCDGFGLTVPQWISPVSTFVVVGFFFLKSLREVRLAVRT